MLRLLARLRRCGGDGRCRVGLTWLLVVVWPATALCGVPLGGVAFCVVMPLLVVCPQLWGSPTR